MDPSSRVRGFCQNSVCCVAATSTIHRFSSNALVLLRSLIAASMLLGSLEVLSKVASTHLKPVGPNIRSARG